MLLVDETDAGPLYDPLLTSYFYGFDTTTSTFTPYNSTDPTGYLNFTGHWGDAEYPDSDERQKGKGLFGFKKYVGGPTGPLDKQLVRKEVWPDNADSKEQRIRTSLDGSTWWKDLVGKIKSGVKGKKKGEEVKRINVRGKEVG